MQEHFLFENTIGHADLLPTQLDVELVTHTRILAVRNRAATAQSAIINAGGIAVPLATEAFTDPNSRLFVSASKHALSQANRAEMQRQGYSYQEIATSMMQIQRQAAVYFPNKGQIVLTLENNTNPEQLLFSLGYILGTGLIPSFENASVEYAQEWLGYSSEGFKRLLQQHRFNPTRDTIGFRGGAVLLHKPNKPFVEMVEKTDIDMQELIKDVYALQLSFTDWLVTTRRKSANIINDPKKMSEALPAFLKSANYKNLLTVNSLYHFELLKLVTLWGGFNNVLERLVSTQSHTIGDEFKCTQEQGMALGNVLYSKMACDYVRRLIAELPATNKDFMQLHSNNPKSYIVPLKRLQQGLPTTTNLQIPDDLLLDEHISTTANNIQAERKDPRDSAIESYQSLRRYLYAYEKMFYADGESNSGKEEIIGHVIKLAQAVLRNLEARRAS